MTGRSVGSDASPLSCFLFRPRKSREKRRKRSHTNVSNASVIRTSRIFQAPLQTPLPCFHQRVKLVLAQSSAKRPTFAFTGESAYTLAFANRIAHNGTHSETGGVSDGGAIITLDTSCTFTNIPGPGVRTANFAAFEPWPEVLSKNAESLRDSDALMRVAVPQASRPRWAALLCLQFGDVAVFSLCAQGFPHMQKRVWYHYPRRAPRVVETLGGRLSKQFICRFLRLGSLH